MFYILSFFCFCIGINSRGMFWVIFIEVYVEVGCFKIRINFEKCGGGNCCRYMFISDNIIVYEG